MPIEREPLLDGDWAGIAFLAPKSSLTDEVDNRRRYFSTSSRKFVNSSIGGHFVVNPIPQFTANCDLSHESLFTDGIDSPGRWWSEVLDDNQQVIHFRPGVMKFNSLTTFFSSFYNVQAGAMARTGRGMGAFYALGRVAGTLVTLPLQPFIFGNAVLNYFLNTPKSKYYYLQPTTFPYRQAVQTIMNTLMSNMGLMAGRAEYEESLYSNDMSLLPNEVDQESMERYYGSLFDKKFFNSRGGIDIFALSTNARLLARNFRANVEKAIEDATGDVKSALLSPGPEGDRKRNEILDRIYTEGVENNLRRLTSKPITLEQFKKEYSEGPVGSVQEDEDQVDWADGSLSIPNLVPGQDNPQSLVDKAMTFLKDTSRQFGLEKDRGADFVSFRVNWTGSQSESFSNSTGESSLASKINEISGRAREIRFNTMEGNILGGVPGAIIEKTVDAAKDVVAGALDSVKLGGAIALAGSAFADIQKMYESSSADLNRTSFTIHLRSWSADPFVRLQTLYYPLAHLLALALPRATGPGSYDGPFLVECFNQGRSLIREGMIESLSITRGVGNVGFDKDNNVLGIDVDVTVVDMSSIVSVPITPQVSPIAVVGAGIAGTAVNAAAGGTNAIFGTNIQVDGIGAADSTLAALSTSTYGDDNKFLDYMNTLSSLSLDYMIDPRRKWKLRMSRIKAEMASQRTAANFGSFLFDTVGGEYIKIFGGSTARR